MRRFAGVIEPITSARASILTSSLDKLHTMADAS